MGFIFFNRVRETMKITSILKRYTLLWWERAPASSWMCCHCLYLYIQVNGCSLAIWGHTVVNRSVLCAFSRVRLVLQVFLIEHKDNTAAMSVFIFWLTNNIKKTLKKLPEVHDWFLFCFFFFSFPNVFASSSSLCTAEQGFCEVMHINGKVELAYFRCPAGGDKEPPGSLLPLSVCLSFSHDFQAVFDDCSDMWLCANLFIFPARVQHLLFS